MLAHDNRNNEGEASSNTDADNPDEEEEFHDAQATTPPPPSSSLRKAKKKSSSFQGNFPVSAAPSSLSSSSDAADEQLFERPVATAGAGLPRLGPARPPCFARLSAAGGLA